MNRLSLVRILALLAVMSPATVEAADWVVAKVSQPSRYTLDKKNWVTIKPGMTISNESWISTGPRGRVILQRNKDRVTFQPGTLVGVFERAGMAIHTDFAQQSGTITLDIDPQKKPHLAVQTPFLAAVVKGTQFSVTVNKSGAKVGVARGRVEVTDAQTGERTGIRAGQEAKVDSDPQTPMKLSGSNANFEPVVKAASFTPMLPPAGQATVLGAPAPAAANPAAEDLPPGLNDTPPGKMKANASSTEEEAPKQKSFLERLFSPSASDSAQENKSSGKSEDKSGKSSNSSNSSGSSRSSSSEKSSSERSSSSGSSNSSRSDGAGNSGGSSSRSDSGGNSRSGSGNSNSRSESNSGSNSDRGNSSQSSDRSSNSSSSGKGWSEKKSDDNDD